MIQKHENEPVKYYVIIWYNFINNYLLISKFVLFCTGNMTFFDFFKFFQEIYFSFIKFRFTNVYKVQNHYKINDHIFSVLSSLQGYRGRHFVILFFCSFYKNYCNQKLEIHNEGEICRHPKPILFPNRLDLELLSKSRLKISSASSSPNFNNKCFIELKC